MLLNANQNTRQVATENPVERQGTGRQENNELEVSDLSRLHVLRGVALESVWGLLEHCPVRSLPGDTTLFRKGESNQTMYMILSGRVRVHIDTEKGGPVVHLDSGQTVGELSVIDNRPVCATVVTACPTRLLAIDESTFWRLVVASHEFSANLLMLLARRMRANNCTILENARIQRKLEKEATTDVLTGLRNRRWLDENFSRFVERNRRSGEPLSVLMLDVDRFKRFNDTHGHAAGDRVLSSVARLIMTKLRPSDRGVRYGGEEFVVIMPATNLEGARTAAERLRRATANTPIMMPNGVEFPPVTISGGVAELAAGDTASTLLARADAALYRAKANGRNRSEIQLSDSPE